MRRIWYNPDGAIVIISFAKDDNEAIESAMQKLFIGGICNPLGTFHDCMTDAEYQSLVPSDRANRNKWRKHPLNDSVIVDNTISDPFDPRQSLLNDLNDAKTLPQLKAIIVKMLG